MGAVLVCGSGKTENAHLDFAYPPAGRFTCWVFMPPSNIDISEHGTSHWATIDRVDSALLGDVVAFRRAIVIRGDLLIPELDPGHGWRPLGAIGMSCCEMSVLSECTYRHHTRINTISDYIVEFISPIDENGKKGMAGVSQIHIPEISKIRDTPWARPTRLGDGRPLNNREVIRVL